MERKSLPMNTMVVDSLQEVDALEVQVLVDNVTDSLSTVPQGVTQEWGHLRESANLVLSGEAICCAAFGLSLLITARVGGLTRVLLFDAGPEAYAIARNGERLKIAFGSVDAIVLSHGHWDHAGGLLEAVGKVVSANGGNPVDCHVNPGMFLSRAIQTPDGGYLPFKDIPGIEALAQAGAAVVNRPEPRLLLENLFYLSGEIPRVTPYERGMPNHLKKSLEGSAWEPDPLVLDERYVATHVKGKGMLIFTACSHAGVINVLKDASKVFADIPLYGIMGGFHLSGAGPEAIIPETVADLRSFGLKKIMPGHCTGWRAVAAMSRIFEGDVLVPCAVGRKFHF
jgi:7,8-dihydropterin-6-yl-methyl-4-(beta-D-ribofuranosyl)aminobenzene 5'-phosphate synthase